MKSTNSKLALVLVVLFSALFAACGMPEDANAAGSGQLGASPALAFDTTVTLTASAPGVPAVDPGWKWHVTADNEVDVRIIVSEETATIRASVTAGAHGKCVSVYASHGSIDTNTLQVCNP